MMKISPDFLNPKILDDLKITGRKAADLGMKAYLVGGVVRDVLLRRRHGDWDIVVVGDAPELAKKISQEVKAKLTVYEQFATATVTFSDGMTLDFATARREHYPHPGALPVVKPGSISDDLCRRDFTINALAVSLSPGDFGEVIDICGGYEDLKYKTIKVLHDRSFIDDPTRILRAVRFEGRLDFTIEAKTLRFLKRALIRRADNAVKPPRYFNEFRKIFQERCPSVPLKRLGRLGGLDFLDLDFKSGLKTLSHVEKKAQSLARDDFYAGVNWPAVYLLAFLSPAAGKRAKDFSRKFHLTREEMFCLRDMEIFQEAVQKLRHKKLKKSDIYEILDPLALEIIFFIRASTSVNMVACRIDEFLKKSRWTALSITGSELKAGGIAPGREMGAILRALLLRKIDGEIRDHKDEIEMAKQLSLENRSAHGPH